MRKLPTYVVALLLTAGCAAPAFAQDFSRDNIIHMLRKVGVHANVGIRNPTDSEVTSGIVKGFSIGLAPGSKNGWKFPVGISGYGMDLDGPSGNQFGRLTMQGVYGGIGYGWHFGSRFNTSIAMQAGYSKNKVNLVNSGGQAFANGDPISVDVANSFVLRPRWHTETYLTKKLTFRTSVNYIIANPDVVVVTAAGRETGKWRANAFNASVGLGIYPFKK
jgi:hypothetical protein